MIYAETSRAIAIQRLKVALKKATGQTWRVYGDRGTAWNWITIHAPKSRCTHPEFGYRLCAEDQATIGRIFETDGSLHQHGYVISPDEREWAVTKAEAAV